MVAVPRSSVEATRSPPRRTAASATGVPSSCSTVTVVGRPGSGAGRAAVAMVTGGSSTVRSPEAAPRSTASVTFPVVSGSLTVASPDRFVRAANRPATDTSPSGTG